MVTYHYINLERMQDPFEFLPLISKLSEAWKEPFIRVDRIVFSNFATARQFLEQIPNTPWKREESESAPSCANCDLKVCEDQENYNISVSPPQIITSSESAYEIERILRVFGDLQSDLKIELLCPDSQTNRDNLKYFLQDKYPDLSLATPVRCSLLHDTFEINYSDLKPKKKRNRKPPAPFQRLLKKSAPFIYPKSIGNDYFGRQVFSSYVALFKNMIDGLLAQDASDHDINAKIEQFEQIPVPPSPLKYFDLQEKEGEIEFRFETYLPLKLFMEWMEILKKISAQFDQSIEMCRCSIVYDYWETDLEQKSARADRFFFSWNDHEFAFREKNYKYLTQFGKDGGFGTFYIKFTPFIEDIDFRVQIIETVVGTQLHLM